jgi:hypothetical protein
MLGDQIKKNELDGCVAWIGGFVGKHEGKEPLAKSRRRKEYDIQIVLTTII